jgi:hypothetical protein
MLGMHGVKDDNGAGGGNDESLNYSYSAAASDSDMSISYDGNSNLETSNLFLGQCNRLSGNGIVPTALVNGRRKRVAWRVALEQTRTLSQRRISRRKSGKWHLLLKQDHLPSLRGK